MSMTNGHHPTPGLGHPEGSRRPVPRVERALVEHLHEGRLLDIGCGRGYGLERFAAYGFEAIGLEIGESTLREAKLRGPVVQGTADRLPYRDASFDVAAILNVLHHMDHPAAGLAEIARVLRPGGFLLLWETTEDSPLVRTGRTLRPQWDGVPVRARFHRRELRSWLTDAGFACDDEVVWGNLLIGASAAGQLAAPLKKLVAALWPIDVWLGRVMPFGQGFYSCLAQRRA